MGLIDRLIYDDVVQDTPPKYLCKYLPPGRIDVMEGQKIRLSQTGALNDPFESAPAEEHQFSDPEFVHRLPDFCFNPKGLFEIAARIRQDGADVPRWSVEEIEKRPVEFMSVILTGAATVIDRNRSLGDRTLTAPGLIDMLLGIVCFAENFDEVLMWSHYTQGYRGYVLVLNTNSAFFTGSKYGVRRVRYANRRPELKNKETWRLSYNLTKSAAWRYEHEWRLLDAFDVGEAFRQEKDDLGFPIVLVDLPPDAVSFVVVSMRTSRDVLDRLKAVLRTEEYEHVEMYTMTCDTKHFLLDSPNWNRI